MGKFNLKDLHEVSPYLDFPYDPSQVNLQGWGSYHPIFEDTIKQIRPELIVEVGTWKGTSAINMAEICRKLGIDASIVCVDTWLGSVEHWENRDDPNGFLSLKLKNGFPQLYYTFLSNVISKGVQDIIIPFPVASIVASEWFKRKSVKPDVIYIDASHEYEQVLQDIKAWFGTLRVGGVMIGDDYTNFWPGVVQSVDKCANELQGFKFLGNWTEKWIAQKLL